MSSIAAMKNIMDWLRDLHAMEQQSQRILKDMIKRLHHYPDLRERIESHLAETIIHEELLLDRIQELGSTPSVVKDFSAMLVAFGQSVAGMTVPDEVVKGAMSAYVFEHLEISGYSIVAAAATAIGDVETTRICNKILPEEIAMADWLLENLPQITEVYLARAAANDKTAKR